MDGCGHRFSSQVRVSSSVFFVSSPMFFFGNMSILPPECKIYVLIFNLCLFFCDFSSRISSEILQDICSIFFFFCNYFDT